MIIEEYVLVVWVRGDNVEFCKVGGDKGEECDGGRGEGLGGDFEEGDEIWGVDGGEWGGE